MCAAVMLLVRGAVLRLLHVRPRKKNRIAHAMPPVARQRKRLDEWGCSLWSWASGSAGNCSFVRSDDFGFLIDAGLGPRQLATRLAAVGLTWSHIQAVLLTHTHTDHWHERTLARLGELHIPFYCIRNINATCTSLAALSRHLLSAAWCAIMRPACPGNSRRR